MSNTVYDSSKNRDEKLTNIKCIAWTRDDSSLSIDFYINDTKNTYNLKYKDNYDYIIFDSLTKDLSISNKGIYKLGFLASDTKALISNKSNTLNEVKLNDFNEIIIIDIEKK